MLSVDLARRIELLTGGLALAVAVVTAIWLFWWTGGDAFVAIFSSELVLPALIVGAAVYLHVRRNHGWARLLVWVGTALALLEGEAMLWIYPFALSLLLMVVAAVAAIRSGGRLNVMEMSQGDA